MGQPPSSLAGEPPCELPLCSGTGTLWGNMDLFPMCAPESPLHGWGLGGCGLHSPLSALAWLLPVFPSWLRAGAGAAVGWAQVLAQRHACVAGTEAGRAGPSLPGCPIQPCFLLLLPTKAPLWGGPPGALAVRERPLLHSPCRLLIGPVWAALVGTEPTVRSCSWTLHLLFGYGQGSGPPGASRGGLFLLQFRVQR